MSFLKLSFAFLEHGFAIIMSIIICCKIMKIVYTDHAKERLKQRDISPLRVFETIRRPERVQRLPDDRKKAVKGYNSRDLVVVYVVESDLFIIITAYYESHI